MNGTAFGKLAETRKPSLTSHQSMNLLEQLGRIIEMAQRVAGNCP